MSSPDEAVSVTAVMRMVFGRRATGRMIAVLGAFFDDSGTHDASPVVVIGGLLGTEEQWDEFERAWLAQLAESVPGKPPLKWFHLSDCRAIRDEFGAYNEAERNRITYLFRRIILDRGLITIAVAVNKLAWDELITEDIRSPMGDPSLSDAIGFCFHKCMEQMLNSVRTRYPGELVFTVFDQGTKKKLDPWAKLYEAVSVLHPEIKSIAFASVRDTPALQGADTIATETYQYDKKWLEDGVNAVPNAHFREYMKRELTTGLIFDRAQILEIAERIKTLPPAFDGRPS